MFYNSPQAETDMTLFAPEVCSPLISHINLGGLLLLSYISLCGCSVVNVKCPGEIRPNCAVIQNMAFEIFKANVYFTGKTFQVVIINIHLRQKVYD